VGLGFVGASGLATTEIGNPAEMVMEMESRWFLLDERRCTSTYMSLPGWGTEI